MAKQDVAGENRGIKRGEISFGVRLLVGFGKTADGDISFELSPDEGRFFRRRRGILIVEPEISQELAERKREEFEREVPARQMRRQLPAQEPGIAPRDDDVEPGPFQTVDEKLPPLDVLNFIQEQIFRLPVDLVESLEYEV
jgi:hypothetical protein